MKLKKHIHKALGINKALGRRRMISRLTRWMLPVLVEPPYVEYKGAQVSYLRMGIMDFLESWQDKIHGQVLDVGVGQWTFSRNLFSDKCTYTATDCFADENIDVVSDIHTLTQTFESEQFDFVLCTDVMEHIPNPALAIEQLYTVLKPGGTLLMTTPFNYPIHTTDEVKDYWRFTDTGLKTLLHRFSQVDVTPNGHPKFPYGFLTVAQK
jgi:2-polyprenyl-3-methyl-5-hydroxy-6-metoxy-1,4-benzoquinol methylase